MSVSVRPAARPPPRTSARAAARSPLPRHPTTFRRDQQFLAFDLLSGVWRLATITKAYSEQWDEQRAHVPEGVWLPLSDRPKQVRLHYVGFFDPDDCDILMCDVPYRLRHITEEDAAECKVDLKVELDTSNHNACSNCLTGGAETDDMAPACCERCPRMYHPDCLRFIDRLTGSREEEKTQQDVHWICPWCRRPELRSRMEDEFAKNRAGVQHSHGETLLGWDRDREEEELKPPYGPQRFFQFVHEYYADPQNIQAQKRRKRRKSYTFGKRRRRKKTQRQSGGRQQEQPADESEHETTESAEQQLEDEAKEDDQQGPAAVHAAIDVPSAHILAQRAVDEALQLVRQMQDSHNRRPSSALRQPGSSVARAGRRVRKREEVDMLIDGEEADGYVSAREEERSGDGEMAEYPLADVDSDNALAFLDGGDYTPTSSAGGISDAESHSPTSPPLTMPNLSLLSYERDDDVDVDDAHSHDVGRIVAPLRSVTPMRERAGDAAKLEVDEVQRAQREPQRVPSPALSSQVPANFVLCPAPHAVKTEDGAAATVSADCPPSTSVASLQPHDLPQSSLPTTSSVSLSDELIVIDDSDDERLLIVPSQPAVQSNPLATIVHDSDTAPTLPTLSSTSSSASSRPRPQIRPSASPSLLSSTSLTSVSKSSSSSSSSSSSLPLRSSVPHLSAAPASAAASTSISPAPTISPLPPSSLPTSSSASPSTASSRPRNRPASYSQQSVGQTGHMRSVRAGGAIQLQSGPLQLSWLPNAADGTGSLRVDGLDFTRPQQVRIGDTVIDLPPLAMPTVAVRETEAASSQLSIITPLGQSAARTSPPLPPFQAAERTGDAQTANLASLSLALPAPVLELVEKNSSQLIMAAVLTDNVLSPPQSYSALTASEPSIDADRLCCFCDSVFDSDKRRRFNRPSSVQLAVLGYTGEPLHPQRRFQCELCYNWPRRGQLPLSLLKARNTDNCAFCNVLLPTDRPRLRVSTARLADIGYDKPPPHPDNAHVCQKCLTSIRFLKRLPACIGSRLSVTDSSPCAVLEEEDDKIGSPADSSSTAVAVQSESLSNSSSSSPLTTVEEPSCDAPSPSSSSSSLVLRANTRNCCLCYRHVDKPRRRPRPSSAQLAALGFTNELPYPQCVWACEPCDHVVSQGRLPVCLQEGVNKDNCAFCNKLLQSGQRHRRPMPVLLLDRIGYNQPPPHPNCMHVCPTCENYIIHNRLWRCNSNEASSSNAAPMEVDKDTRTHLTSPAHAQSTAETAAMLASRRQHVKGGNQSEFIKDSLQLATAARREKRQRRLPSRYASSESDGAMVESESDSGEEDESRSSKKTKTAAGSSEPRTGRPHSAPTQTLSYQRYVQDEARPMDSEEKSDGEGERRAAREWDAEQDRLVLELDDLGRSVVEMGEVMDRSRLAITARLQMLRPRVASDPYASSSLFSASTHQWPEQLHGEEEGKGCDSDDYGTNVRARRWTAQQEQRLMELTRAGTSPEQIGKELRRSTRSIYARTHVLRHRKPPEHSTSGIHDNNALQPPTDQRQQPEEKEKDGDGEEKQEDKAEADERTLNKHQQPCDAQEDKLLLELEESDHSLERMSQVMCRSVNATRCRLSILKQRRALELSRSSLSSAAQHDSNLRDEQQDLKDSEKDGEEEEQETGDRAWNAQQDQQLLALEAEGKGCREIGRMMGNRTRGAVKSRLYRLRHGLTDKESRGEKSRQLGVQRDKSIGGRPQEWTAERDTQLLTLNDEGHLLQSIADMIGVSFQSAHNRMKRLRHEGRANGETDEVSEDEDEVTDGGMHESAKPPPPRSHRPWRTQDESELKRLVAEGLSSERIAEQMERTVVAIKKRIHNLGLRRPSKALASSAGEKDEKDEQKDNKQEDKPPTNLSEGTWEQLSIDGAEPWLFRAYEYRAVKQKLSSHEGKGEKGERNHDDNKRLFEAARPMYPLAHAVFERLRKQMKAKYGRSNKPPRTPNRRTAWLAWDADAFLSVCCIVRPVAPLLSAVSCCVRV